MVLFLAEDLLPGWLIDMWNEPYPPRPCRVHTPILPELNTGVPASCLQGRQARFHVGGWWLVLSIINKQKGQDPHYHEEWIHRGNSCACILSPGKVHTDWMTKKNWLGDRAEEWSRGPVNSDCCFWYFTSTPRVFLPCPGVRHSPPWAMMESLLHLLLSPWYCFLCGHGHFHSFYHRPWGWSTGTRERQVRASSCWAWPVMFGFIAYPKWEGWASQVVLVVKNLPAHPGDLRDAGFIPGSGRSPGGGHGNPLQYSCLPGESHGQRILAGYIPWGHKESDMTEATERAHTQGGNNLSPIPSPPYTLLQSVHSAPLHHLTPTQFSNLGFWATFSLKTLRTIHASPH